MTARRAKAALARGSRDHQTKQLPTSETTAAARVFQPCAPSRRSGHPPAQYEAPPQKAALDALDVAWGWR